jgi:hypothetical protein
MEDNPELETIEAYDSQFQNCKFTHILQHHCAVKFEKQGNNY